MTLTPEQIQQAREDEHAARMRARRGPYIVRPKDFADAQLVTYVCGYLNVARYIALRKSDIPVTRYEAFMSCFSGTLDEPSMTFEKITAACIAFESTHVFMHENAYAESLEIIEMRRQTDDSYTAFLEGLKKLEG